MWSIHPLRTLDHMARTEATAINHNRIIPHRRHMPLCPIPSRTLKHTPAKRDRVRVTRSIIPHRTI
jgi:hypothetical protein